MPTTRSKSGKKQENELNELLDNLVQSSNITDVNHVILNSNLSETLSGLYKKECGFLIAPPDSGKSYLCLSIAYDAIFPYKKVLSLCSEKRSALNVLIWPIEDGIEKTLSRFLKHVVAFNATEKQTLEQKLYFYKSNEPLITSGYREVKPDSQEIKNLITVIKQLKIDLLIIDTLRIACGSANEVTDDHVIYTTLNQIAREGDISVLTVHHPTKSVTRGLQPIDSVSGSGLSKTLSSSKYHLYLDVGNSKGKKIFKLTFIKANYLPIEDKNKDRNLKWHDNSLITTVECQLEGNIKTVNSPLSNLSDMDSCREKKSKKILELSSKEPLLIEIDPSVQDADNETRSYSQVHKECFYDILEKHSYQSNDKE